jgi:ribosomal protein S18 acetylase RimI-like enzyme
MAARIEPAPATSAPYLVDLRQLCALDLEELLEEEIRTWREQLYWDFRKSADLVRRFVDMRALQGCALIAGGEVMGYAYLVIEELKALIGDLYVREAYRCVENENWLFDHMIGSLISGRSYQNHVDGQINDQYRSVAGARRFLFNIVQYPGCGAFFRPASVAAFDLRTGRMWGMCLASLVAPDCGHITQLCVTPAARGCGLGHELLRHSLSVLRDSGCQRVSLTVTAANSAVRLYQRMGFFLLRPFSACVWEGF